MQTMSDRSAPDNTGADSLNSRLDCPGCVRSFRTESALDRHLGRNPSHNHGSDATSTGDAWDNGWVTFDDRVERAVVVPPTTETVNVAVLVERNVIRVTGDHDTTVALPETAGACVDTLRWQLSGGVLRLTLDR